MTADFAWQKTLHIFCILCFQDVNDHKPIFTEPGYTGAVLRTADLSTVVISGIQAIDADMPVSLWNYLSFLNDKPYYTFQTKYKPHQ